MVHCLCPLLCWSSIVCLLCHFLIVGGSSAGPEGSKCLYMLYCQWSFMLSDALYSWRSACIVLYLLPSLVAVFLSCYLRSDCVSVPDQCIFIYFLLIYVLLICHLLIDL